ncbi:hypothetical protein HAZT_HAZT008924 [Hyalella azteca]|uniref:Uncharacterized protein n=1 Tax=Hyalella azteca TaxID=294128 RepID=A0A6A0H7W3_HYAAZ|nr:hypothetical protein HAZT_HAZT008924 [Hyalella azteca]
MSEQELMLSFSANTTNRTGEGFWGIGIRLLNIYLGSGSRSGSFGADWSNTIRFVPRADYAPDTRVCHMTLEQLCDEMERCSRVDGDVVEEVSYYATRLVSNQQSATISYNSASLYQYLEDFKHNFIQFFESLKDNFVLFPESFMHNFVILKIGRGYWSLDKFHDGIVIQRSLSVFDVMSKCLNNSRIIEGSGCRLECSRRNEFHSSSSRPNKTMKDFIGWMKESEHLSRPYNVISSNCVCLTKELEEKFHR